VRNRWLGFVVAVLVLAAGVWAYPHLPPRVPTHWNFRGEVDGYSSRFGATVVFPLVILALAGLMQVLPKIDPRGKNYAKFGDTYWLIVNGILIFCGVIQLLVLANGLGAPVSLGRVLPIGIGFLMMVLGNYLGRIQPNWFIGIRTPWTLSSDEVWRKTHRLGGRLFVAAGILFMLSVLVPGMFGMPLIVILIVVVAVIPVLYSLYLWMRERST
jgi:uncharacterized membrane protein